MSSVHINKLTGRWRARWRTPAGRMSKTFDTAAEAAAYLSSIGHAHVGRQPVSADALRARITSSISIDPRSGCWNWTRSLFTSTGYAQLQLGSSVPGRSTLGHRVSYEMFRGEIPEGLVIDHLCRNRACVNPDHLEPVTQRENTLRSPIAIGAINAAKTHCAQGHEYSPENTYTYRMKPPRSCVTRSCRACMAAQKSARRGAAA